MSRGPDAATQLERALVQVAAAAGIDLTIVAADCTRWASVTFTGARHRLWLHAAPSAALDIWLSALPEMEFKLQRNLVADLIVADVRRGDQAQIEIEVLTVEES